MSPGARSERPLGGGRRRWSVAVGRRPAHGIARADPLRIALAADAFRPVAARSWHVPRGSRWPIADIRAIAARPRRCGTHLASRQLPAGPGGPPSPASCRCASSRRGARLSNCCCAAACSAWTPTASSSSCASWLSSVREITC